MNINKQTPSNSDIVLPVIKDSVRLAILLPTFRWSAHVRSLIGSLIGVANDEVIILIGDNSESSEKKDFLNKINDLNPFILSYSHHENIGSFNNYIFLHDWCKNVQYSAILTDDDWMSPTYHTDAFRFLLSNKNSSSCSIGTTFVDIGDGDTVNVNQPSMEGLSPLERMRSWSGIAARATMYNTSRRLDLEPAIEFMRRTPLNGITLIEDLWELSRLAKGDFHNLPGQGIYVHYPATRTIGGDETARFYNLICKNEGLEFPFVYFAALSTAVQCALFLLGNLSPLNSRDDKYECAQHIFRHIYKNHFLPHVTGTSSHDAAIIMFADHPAVLKGFINYCNPNICESIIFDSDILSWFIEVIRVFEDKSIKNKSPISDRFTIFVNDILS